MTDGKREAQPTPRPLKGVVRALGGQHAKERMGCNVEKRATGP